MLNRTIMSRLYSAAGTGYFYVIKKPRSRPQMMLRKYDPRGQVTSLLRLICTDYFTSHTVRQHVLFVEQKKK